MLVAVVTGAVVAFVGAATVFHVSASGSAATQYVVGTRCPDDNGVLIRYSRDLTSGRQLIDLRGVLPEVRDLAARHGLDLVRHARYVQPLAIAAGDQPLQAQLLARDGAFEHLRPTAGGGTAGAWVPDDLARRYGVQPGGVLTVDTPSGRRQLPVAATYLRLGDPLDGYWCSQRRWIVPNPLSAAPELATIVVSAGLMDSLVGTEADLAMVTEDVLQVTSASPARTGTQAAEHARRIQAAGVELLPAVAGKFKIEDRSVLQTKTGPRAHRAVAESLLPLSGVTLLVGLGAVVGLGRQWVQRRAAEVRLLWVRGAAPAVLGVKAVLELVLPLAVGTAAGWFAAQRAVPLWAPAAQLDPWAPTLAAVAAAAGWLIGIVVLGFAVGARVRGIYQPRSRPEPGRTGLGRSGLGHSGLGHAGLGYGSSHAGPGQPRPGSGRLARGLRWVPWELVAAGAAVLSYLRLRRGAVAVDPSSLLPVVDAFALLFPLLCLAVVVGVAVRLAAVAQRAGHRLRGWRVPAALWAVRRLAAQQRLVAALLAVAGLAVGVIVVGVGVSGTEKAAMVDKGRVFVGSDAAIRLRTTTTGEVDLPAAIAGTSTVISIHEVAYGARRGRVLVVDPATFANGVSWNPEWADGAELPALLARLGPAGADGRVPAIQVGNDPIAMYENPDVPPAKVVATVPTFVGRGHADGMLVISNQGMAAVDRRAYSRFVLTRGDLATTSRELAATDQSTGAMITATGATDGLPFLVVAWTFDFFVLIGAVLAAVAATALLVAAEARRRATAVAHALLARMGLRVRALALSHVIELSAVATVAVAAGLVGGWLVLIIAGHRLDPASWLSPQPVPASLLLLGLLVVAVTAAAVIVVAALAVRAALRAPVRELLRG
jgi:putative ABC transport system permease protein